jgi:uncharacterized membrane protein YfcA
VTQELFVLAATLSAAGILAGVLAGLLGVGGGIVLVPVLELAFATAGVPADLRMHLAVGTSLASIVPTALSSARAHAARGAIDSRLARRWSPAIAAGATLGAIIAAGVRGAVLSAVFGVVALAAGLRMIAGQGSGGDGRDRQPAAGKWLPLPVAIGTVSAMMGIGGGTLSVPVMTALGLPVHRAVGTSSWFGLWIAVPAAAGFAWLGRGVAGLPAFSAGYVNLMALVVLLPATVLAAPLGVRLAHRLSRRRLSAIFGAFLLLTSARMLYRAWMA